MRDLQLRERSAADAIYRGAATEDELALLATSVRVALELARRGYGALHGTALKAADETLRTAEPDADLVAAALAAHDQQRRVAPQRQYVAALTAAAAAS
ncbi:MAG: hypothetical protein KF683_00900 [Rubrivivax sp.]|nr:hypothetical protein [Rubrivivax sp.]